MKSFSVSLSVVIMLLLPSTAMAQAEGAIIERGQGSYDVAWAEYDGSDTLVILSTYPNFHCEDSQSRPDRWQFVLTPTGALHYQESGQYFARVYHGTWEDLMGTDTDPKDPIDFMCSQEYTAEGILSFMIHDNDAFVSGRGAEVWGQVINGVLTDLTEECKSGKVNVQMVHLWRIAPKADLSACDPSCVEILVYQGPTVKCAK